MEFHTIGIDLGKTVFHLVGLNRRGEVVVRKKCSRSQILPFTSNLRVFLIGMEACGGAHFLGRLCASRTRCTSDAGATRFADCCWNVASRAVLSKGGVYRHVVKQYARKLGFTQLAPHDLRRSCAKLCHASGGELDQIQFLLVHVSVQTTERYLGCKQRIRGAVNGNFGIEPQPGYAG
jgi:site-specific recombinase XerC